MRFIGVLNKDGGTFRTLDMEAFAREAEAVFAERGHQLECRIVAGADIVEELQRAAAEPGIEALLAGGGDGTISTAAGICFRTGVPLAILPAGTMNLFARSLKIPQKLDEALVALAEGEVRAVDIATANDRPFVHQYSVGIHPRLVRIRESLHYHSRIGKMLASLRAILFAVSRPPRFTAEVRTPRGAERRKLSGISVSNNILGEGHIPHADEVDRGVLGVYVIKPVPAFEMAKLCFQVLVGTWKDHPKVSESEVSHVSLFFPKRKSSAQAVIDGELIDLDKVVVIRSCPGALKVVAPISADKLVAEKSVAEDVEPRSGVPERGAA